MSGQVRLYHEVFVSLILAPLTLAGCVTPVPKAITAWRDYRLSQAEYDAKTDKLHLILSGGSFAQSLDVRRLSTSTGLAIDPVRVWAPKMWAHANVTIHGVSGLNAPGWVAFELFERPDRVRQRVRLEIAPPPELSVSSGGEPITPRRRP